MSNTLILHLALIDGVGPSMIKYLIEHKPTQYSWTDLYAFSLSDWKRVFDCSDRLAAMLVSGLSDTKMVEKELILIEKHKAQISTLLDDDYPPLLREIHYPPAVVWWQGSDCWKRETKMLAIVGSRKANFYAQTTIDTFVPLFVAQGWTVVSGGALGVDGMAHSAVVKAGGKTVVVLGSGLMHKYPHSHETLFESVIAAQGTVLSIFPMDMQARPTNFPIRNRVVSGLSKGCFVVQAAAKSGALITAQHALEQGRDVFALPGSIKDPLSAGCHALIQQGATLVAGVEDIVHAYQDHVKAAESTHETAMQQSIDPQLPHTLEDVIKAACVTPLFLDDLLAITNISRIELQAALFDLQLTGAIRQDFSGMWVS
jgi:DNA processing protein